MKLEAKHKTPERILLYGDPGSGKSRAAVDVARAATGRVLVLDTDYSSSWFRSIDAHPELADTVEVWQVGPDDWAGQIRAVTEMTKQAGGGDWVVIDSITPTWLAVRTLYIQRRYGDDFFDFFATGKDKQMSDADMNWNAINSEYSRLYRAVFGSPAHVLLTAEADAMTTATQSGKQVAQDRGIKTHYQTIGWKPKGQKTLAYTPHTVIWLNKDRVGGYYMTTAKDRERTEIEAREVKDFSRDYLMRVAGWRPVKDAT